MKSGSSFDALLQPLADLVEQRVLLAIDIAAGLVVGAPGLVALAFQRPRLALALELLRQSRAQACGLLGCLERLVQLVELGLERGAPVLGPAVELVHLDVEPAAVAGRHLFEQLAVAGARASRDQRRSTAAGTSHGAPDRARQVEEPPALRLVERCRRRRSTPAKNR